MLKMAFLLVCLTVIALSAAMPRTQIQSNEQLVEDDKPKVVVKRCINDDWGFSGSSSKDDGLQEYTNVR